MERLAQAVAAALTVLNPTGRPVDPPPAGTPGVRQAESRAGSNGRASSDSRSG